MSHEILTNDQVAALVEAARSGALVSNDRPRAAERQRRIRKVDFTRPTKFTTDQERKIRRALDAFCRSASTRLSAEMRIAIELEVISTTQLLWSNAHAQLPQTSICAVVEAQPIDTRMLLGAELPLVLSSIDWLLGSSHNELARERKLTEIDWALARHFFGTLLGQLSVIWTDFAGIELQLASLETALESAQLAPVSEPTLSLTMEARIGRGSATLVLLIPHRSIVPVAERFSSDEGYTGTDDPRLADAVHGALRDVEVALRAEVGGRDMTIDAVLELRPGDLLRLDAKAADGVRLYADLAPVRHAKPGRSGRRRAVQIVAPPERERP